MARFLCGLYGGSLLAGKGVERHFSRLALAIVSSRSDCFFLCVDDLTSVRVAFPLLFYVYSLQECHRAKNEVKFDDSGKRKVSGRCQEDGHRHS